MDFLRYAMMSMCGSKKNAGMPACVCQQSSAVCVPCRSSHLLHAMFQQSSALHIMFQQSSAIEVSMICFLAQFC